MLTRLLSSAAILAALAVPPAAHAVDFRWANDGDVGAMDPYTRRKPSSSRFWPTSMSRWFAATAISGWSRRWRTSWEQNQPDVWRFHLRPGVKWQDGSPFTADDVVFSLRRIHVADFDRCAPQLGVKAIAEGRRH